MKGYASDTQGGVVVLRGSGDAQGGLERCSDGYSGSQTVLAEGADGVLEV